MAVEQKDEAMARKISEANQERMASFTFSMCNIVVGEKIEFLRDGFAAFTNLRVTFSSILRSIWH